MGQRGFGDDVVESVFLVVRMSGCTVVRLVHGRYVLLKWPGEEHVKKRTRCSAVDDAWNAVSDATKVGTDRCKM